MDAQTDRYGRYCGVLAIVEPYTGDMATESSESFGFLIPYLCDAFLSNEIIQTMHRTFFMVTM